jgi:bifunctional non-homologous end joining protein LigD
LSLQYLANYSPYHGNLKFQAENHGASNLHYDFRLEVGSVLVSWAVTEVPSPNPKDECGAGTVQV